MSWRRQETFRTCLLSSMRRRPQSLSSRRQNPRPLRQQEVQRMSPILSLAPPCSQVTPVVSSRSSSRQGLCQCSDQGSGSRQEFALCAFLPSSIRDRIHIGSISPNVFTIVPTKNAELLASIEEPSDIRNRPPINSSPLRPRRSRSGVRHFPRRMWRQAQRSKVYLALEPADIREHGVYEFVFRE